MKFRTLLAMLLLLVFQAKAQQGLQVDYFTGRNFEKYVGSKSEAKLDLRWELTGPLPGMGPSEFSARIKGFITVPVSGLYTFSVRVDDGLRLSIGGVKLFNTWQDNNHVSLRRKLYLEKDRFYALEAEYYNGILEGELVLIWELPQEAPENLKRSWQGRVTADWFTQNIPLDKIKPKSELVPLPEAPSNVQLSNKNPQQVVIDNQPRPQPKPTPSKPKVQVPVKQPQASILSNKPKPQGEKVKLKVKDKSKNKKPVVSTPKPRIVKPLVAPKPLPDSLIVLSKRTASRIGFVKSKAELLPASFAGLDSLADKLKRYPFIMVEINGHTDYVGDSTNNLKLSLKRAQAVSVYLVEKGIEANRLKVQGFGGKFPLSYLDTEEEHNRNRSVEIKLYRKE